MQKNSSVYWFAHMVFFNKINFFAFSFFNIFSRLISSIKKNKKNLNIQLICYLPFSKLIA
ncbi:hypothetical protein MDIS_01230 [Mesomycoplasma dispar]|nr:hypothetical protein MDIS_01230 [Mesomycoplasma dispar]